MTMNDLHKNAFVDPNRKDSYPSTSLMDQSLITSYTIFTNLTFWNKIEFINATSNKELLQDIHNQSSSKQIKALALFRLNKLPQ